MARIACAVLFFLMGVSFLEVQAQDSLYHVVRKEEILSKISLIYNKRIDRILRDNQLQSAQLEVGDTLLIILPAGSKYFLSLKKGEITEVKSKNTDLEKQEKTQEKSQGETDSSAKNSKNAQVDVQKADQEFKPSESNEIDSSSVTENVDQPKIDESELEEESGVLQDNTNFYDEITKTILRNNHDSKIAHLVILINLVLLVFTIFMLLVGFSSRFYKIYRAKKKKRYSEFFENVLTYALFSTEEEDQKQYEISISYFKNERIAKKRIERSWLINLFILLHNDLVGETEDHLQKLFLMHRLDKDVQRNLHSKKWYVKAKAIHEIGNMQLSEFSTEIKKSTSSQNKEIAFKSLLTLVQLDKENPLAFLKNLENPLNEWQQLQLLNGLSKLNETKITFDVEWLQSSKESLVVFAIRFCVQFNKHEFISDIIKNIDSTSLRIQLEVIRAIGILGDDSNIELLKSKMITDIPSKKQGLIKAISLLQMEPDSNFFKNEIQHADFDTALVAAKSFYSIPNGIEELEIMKMDENESENVRSIVAHALDRRL